MKKVALTIEEIEKLKKPIRNVNIEYREKLSDLEKFAVWFTDKIGTMGFFFFLLVFNMVWILWNVFAPTEMIFDASWSFLILLFINNILQILFMPLIMVGQNLQGRHSEARAQADFEINTKAENEIETILIHLENQSEMLTEIQKKLDK
jgi:uncharacterized membrane protein